jgi:hypothetical protein
MESRKRLLPDDGKGETSVAKRLCVEKLNDDDDDGEDPVQLVETTLAGFLLADIIQFVVLPYLNWHLDFGVSLEEEIEIFLKQHSQFSKISELRYKSDILFPFCVFLKPSVTTRLSSSTKFLCVDAFWLNDLEVSNLITVFQKFLLTSPDFCSLSIPVTVALHPLFVEFFTSPYVRSRLTTLVVTNYVAENHHALNNLVALQPQCLRIHFSSLRPGTQPQLVLFPRSSKCYASKVSLAGSLKDQLFLLSKFRLPFLQHFTLDPMGDEYEHQNLSLLTQLNCSSLTLLFEDKSLLSHDSLFIDDFVQNLCFVLPQLHSLELKIPRLGDVETVNIKWFSDRTRSRFKELTLRLSTMTVAFPSDRAALPLLLNVVDLFRPKTTIVECVIPYFFHASKLLDEFEKQLKKRQISTSVRLSKNYF